MKAAVIVHPRGMEGFVAELSDALLARGVAARTTTWADLSVPALADQAGDVALVVCYGPRPEDTVQAARRPGEGARVIGRRRVD